MTELILAIVLLMLLSTALIVSVWFRKGTQRRNIHPSNQQLIDQAFDDPVLGALLRDEVDLEEFMDAYKKPMEIEREGPGPWLIVSLGTAYGSDFRPLLPAGSLLPVGCDVEFQNDPRKVPDAKTPLKCDLHFVDPERPSDIVKTAEIHIRDEKALKLAQRVFRVTVSLDSCGNISAHAEDKDNGNITDVSVKILQPLPIDYHRRHPDAG